MSELPRNPHAADVERKRVLARASLGTATGTVLSRITGLVRFLLVAIMLGGGSLGDTFNLANNTPNIIHDLVLGGVLAATFVPVFVERLTTRSAFEANESISAVVTLAATVLVVTTILFVLFAPEIIDLYAIFTSNSVPPSERALAVELLRFFAPQLLFYGAISLMSAVLATRDRFTRVGFVPIVNNLVGIVVLVIFGMVFHAPGHGHSVVLAVQRDTGLVVLLGLGMTVGVAAQAACLVPAMRRAGIHLHFVYRPRDPAIRRILSLSTWTFGFVVANQVAVFIVLALALRRSGAVSAYTYAYIFFQFPFAIVATSIINVASPDLARLFTAGNLRGVALRFGAATRQVIGLITPAMVGYLILAQPALDLLIRHRAETAFDAHQTAAALALFALGLPGFCLFFLATRTLQAMQDTRTAFFLYALENGTNIVVAFALFPSLGVKGLALSYSIAYSVAAIASLKVLRDRLGSIGGNALVTQFLHSLVLSALMAVAVAFVSAILGNGSGLVGWVKLLIPILVGIGVYIGAAGVAGSLGGWQNARRHGARRSTANDRKPKETHGRHSRRH